MRRHVGWIVIVAVLGVLGMLLLPGMVSPAAAESVEAAPGAPGASAALAISQGADDAHEVIDTGAMNLTVANLTMTNFRGRIVGLRFQNVPIPPGSTVTGAYLEFTAYAANSGDTSLTIQGQADDNAPTFTTAAYNLSGRSRTAASVAWSSIPAWEAEGVYQSPDLTAVIQQIVDRPGWAEGNALVLIVSGAGQRQAYSYNGSAAKAAKLHLTYTTALPVVQVTSTNGDYAPSIFRAADGKLWAFYHSYRADGFCFLWYQTGEDDGSTWSEATALTAYTDDYRPAAMQAADGTIWVVWLSNRSGNGDLWYKTYDGTTWSDDMQLTTDPGWDGDPAITQDSDGAIWVVWRSERLGNADIWYKTWTNAVGWSGEVQVTSDPDDYDYQPTIAQAADEAVWVVWERNGVLTYRATADGGATWSAESQIDGNCCYYDPSLVVTDDGVLWLASERDGDTWLQQSTNGGATWSAPEAYTRYAGSDYAPDLAALPGGRVALAWTSERGDQWWGNIWYGVYGVHGDVNPPPWAGWLGVEPGHPTSGDVVAISVEARDESPGLAVSLVWSVDGTAQADLPMVDDGTHGDVTAGDGRYTASIGPFAAGSTVRFQARAVDGDGNAVLHPSGGPGAFSVVEPFVKTADLLFVPDREGGSTDRFRGYFTAALDELGYAYDLWDTGLRGAPDSALLSQYSAGTVLWAVYEWGYLGWWDIQQSIQGYLDAGGRLFLTGQNVAETLNGTSLLSDYLHAAYVHYDTGLHALNGVTGDPIGDGLALQISGGDGANNQWSPDEIDPIAPAETVLTYNPGALAALGEPVKPAAAAAALPTPTPTPVPEGMDAGRQRDLRDPYHRAQPKQGRPEDTAGALELFSSGTGGLRVEDTISGYKVVFFSFGFEGINNAGDRSLTMERVLAWLNGVPPRPVPISPADGAAVAAGDVIFRWQAVAGASGYEIQIDTVDTFDSPDLIVATSSGTEHTAALTLGTWYWRVRAAGRAYTAAWQVRVVEDVVQVTADPGDDYQPALLQAADGTLWVVWYSWRSGNADLWYKTSTDGGATWSAEAQLTTDEGDDSDPDIAQAADGTLWVVWYSYRSGNPDLWYKTSADGGATWSTDAQLTDDPNDDYNPAIARAADGRLWVVWHSYRSGDPDLWYKTSIDGGATWSTDAQLTTDSGSGYAPTIAQAADGAVWVVWERYGLLRARTTADGGSSWSPERDIDGNCCYYEPSLVTAEDGTLWLASGRDNDIWVQASGDHGASWSPAERYTRFVGWDGAPDLAALSGDRVGVAWNSERGGDYDVWFGILGEREDLSPPPYVNYIWHEPDHVDAADPVTFIAYTRDEAAAPAVELIWTLDGVPQSSEPMYDDGTHGDTYAGDDEYAAQLGPFAAGQHVEYTAWATDIDGNSFTCSWWNSFTVVPVFVKTADLLLVLDNNAWVRPYFTAALDDLGYAYDVWDTDLRGAPDGAVLSQYSAGAVIWAVPHWGYISYYTDTRQAVQDYLDGGGKLFITGQDIASDLDGSTLLSDYLHAAYVQYDSGLYALNGATGDPIGAGLALAISGGDGANNQWSPDEIDPIAPAETILTYDAAALAPLAEPVPPEADTTPEGAQRPGGRPEAGPPGRAEPDRRPERQPPAGSPQVEAEAAAPQDTQGAQANISSGTGGLRVDTGGYKVVYFSFGFEGINNAGDRSLTMERVLAWLNGVLPRPLLISPADGSTVATGDVTFRWQAVPGATGYEIQIDTVDTFDSPDLIGASPSGTEHTANLAAGTWYWRVRAAGGAYTIPWQVRLAGPVVQVTTGPDWDYDPSLVQAADSTLWAVWYSYQSGNCDLWYATSADEGATWSAEAQLTVDLAYDYAPAIAQAADGTLWVAWVSDRSGSYDLWYKTYDGATWSAEARLTDDPSSDFAPSIAQAADGTIWVVWYAYRSSSYDLWYKTYDGAAWSAEAQLTDDPGHDYRPTVAQAADGTVWVVWYRYGVLWARTSADGGASWSPEREIDGNCCYYYPSLVAAGDGTLWLASRSDDDIWIQGSGDDGATWSSPERYTRFVGWDGAPDLAALGGSRVGLAWESERSANYDIWFGILGEQADVVLPPYLDSSSHVPWPNPLSDDVVTIRAYPLDETGIAGVTLLWELDGVPQADAPMYDDGAHGDWGAGDGTYGVQIGPFAVGQQVRYRVQVTDGEGNSYTPANWSGFQALAPFVKTADLLLVPDYGGNSTDWFRPYFTSALDDRGYAYDVWDTALRGAPDAAVLNQYILGTIIWAAPDWGYYEDYGIRQALQNYLDAGGKLFITGQDIGFSISGSSFYQDYLHAAYVQDNVDLYALSGAAGDPIGDALALQISGGDGADNQSWPDEIDPIAPAEIVLTYDAAALGALAGPLQPEARLERQELDGPDGRPSSRPDRDRSNGRPQEPPPTGAAERKDEPSMPEATSGVEGIGSSGTGGLRVNTGLYRVVYFSFGFEAINSAADRAEVMDRVLSWLSAGEPDADVTPTGLDFGDVLVGLWQKLTLWVQNLGDDHLVVSGVDASDPTLFVSPIQFTLPPGSASQAVDVTYSPAAPQPLNATLTIHSNDPDTPEWVVGAVGNGIDPPPTNLAAVAFSATQIDLTWEDNSSFESAFHVERSADAGATWTEIATLPADTTAYSDTGLACGTPYQYRVRAFWEAAGVFSDYTNVAEAETKACGVPVTAELKVSAGSDDAHETKSTGAVALAATTLNMTYNDKRIVGLRFRNLPIPPGTTITGAYLEFTASAADSAAAALTIQGQAGDNPPTFTTAVRNISSRATTGASASWAVPAWVLNKTYQSPDLAPILQELVDRPGWAENNSLVFVISGTGQRRAFSYNAGAAKAPKLVVTYLGTLTPVVDLRVTGGSNDAHEVKATGLMNLSATALNMTYNNKRLVGLRYQGVSLPQGVTITESYLEFTASAADSAAAALTIQGQADDNPLTFTTAKWNLSSRARTAASVSWAAPAWVLKKTYRSPDLSAVVQEIVDRPGWSPNNALVFIISGTGQRRAYSTNGSAVKAPLLHVVYDPGTGLAPVVLRLAGEAPVVEPTPEITLTVTLTPTVQPTPVVTPTVEPTPVITPTATPAPTVEPTPLVTPTIEPTPVITPTSTPTPEPPPVTPTVTVTPTVPVTGTLSPAETATPGPEETGTPPPEATPQPPEAHAPWRNRAARGSPPLRS